MGGDGADLSLCLHESTGGTGKGSVNLKTLNKGGRSYKFHLGYLGLESVPAVLVEEDLGVDLFSHLALGPLLFLGLAARKGSLELLLLGFLLNLRSLLVKKE
tara:strand:+ start:252 stop:557 length:306 start_codon:yes stop_codon:yes gene_type:complete